jgi:hypothetical protein
MKMTWKKLFRLVEDGYGQGHGDAYKPFLQVRRRNVSNRSNQSYGAWLFGYTREFHYFARGERLIALLLVWLGAKDVREQFPLWPMPHLHPVIGAPGSENLVLSEAPGLMDLAEAAGIAHGMNPGSEVPYIATIDLMCTAYLNRIPFLIAVSCKPRQLIDDADAASRMLERLELERRYLKAVKVRYHVADKETYSRHLYANLCWLMPDGVISQAACRTSELLRFRDLLREQVYDTPIDRAIADAARSARLPAAIANSAFRFLAWHQEIDIDIAHPIPMTLPARRGGVALRHALQRHILGEIDSESL